MNYKQNWPAYNEAQTTEKQLFLDILSELCSYIPMQEQQGAGRPSAPLDEMVFSCVAKVYEKLSSRRNSTDLKFACDKGYIGHNPHFNTVLKYFGDERLTPLLTSLIQLSALPLKDIEDTFAVDASGLSSAFYSRWFDVRFNGDKRYHDWLKVHLICGTKSNIVTHIVITGGTSHDSPQFPVLVKETAKHFEIKEISADKGYSSRENVQLVCDIGAVPFIPYKTSASGRSGGSCAWRRMYLRFQLHREEFMEHYHRRSNVESTFSMLKRKFSNKLMMKKEVGKTNEALAKVLCHNICVLIHEFYESGIDLKFSELVRKFSRLNAKEAPFANHAFIQ
jgi:transposase